MLILCNIWGGLNSVHSGFWEQQFRSGTILSAPEFSYKLLTFLRGRFEHFGKC